MMKRRTLLSALAAASAAAALPSRAQSNPKIVFGYTAVSDFASVFVAAEEGYFKKRNLDVELKFIPLNSTIPAALPKPKASTAATAAAAAAVAKTPRTRTTPRRQTP